MLVHTQTQDKIAAPGPATQIKQAPGRKPQIDVLRGTAILLVLLSHPVGFPTAPGAAQLFASKLHDVGQSGVDLFFVLSGFLVGGLLLSEIRTTGKLDVKRFLIRRGLKIWPGYYAFLAIAFIGMFRHHSLTINELPARLLPFVFNLQNYIGPFDIITHTWSLAVEEHFYLVLPLVISSIALLSMKRRNLSALPVLIITFLGLCNGLRFYNATTRPHEIADALATHLRMDSLFFGVLISYVHQYHRERIDALSKHRWLLLVAGVAMLVIRFSIHADNHSAWTFGFTELYLAYGCILVALITIQPEDGWLGRAITNPISKAIAFVGFYSYSIYLWHFQFAGPFVMDKVLPHLPDSMKWMAGTAIYIALAVLTGVLAAHIIEIPMLLLRDRLFPSSIAPKASLQSTAQLDLSKN